MNLCILSGRLVRDIELQATQSGKEMVRNCIAVNGGKNADGTPITNFIDFVAYSGNAKFIASYCAKGDLVLINANIVTGSYEKDGNKVKTTTIMVDRIEKLVSSGNQPQEQHQEPKPKQTVRKSDNVQPEITKEDLDFTSDDMEDLPF